MSVWKKATKINQKTHRERHQPEERKHLGILPKKKDYVREAKDYNQKKETLKLLRKRALNKNPDEFYHHMINSKVENGMHFDKETEDEDTPEQLKLITTQNLKYIRTKRQMELKKIEKLQSQLHLTSVERDSNKHVYFDDNGKKIKKDDCKLVNENLNKFEIPDVDLDELIESSKHNKLKYEELSKRIKREKELAVVQQKLEIKHHVSSKHSLPPKKLKKGNKNRAPVYVWKYERKR